MVRDGKWFARGESDERRTGYAEGAAVVGVRGSKVVASVDGLLHEAAPVLAPPHGILVVQLGRRASHR